MIKVPIVIFFHTYYFKNRETKFNIINTLIKQTTIAYLRVCYMGLKNVIAPTKAAVKFLVSDIGLNPNSVDILPFPIFNNIDRGRRISNKKKDIIKLLYAGRITKGKNVDLLVSVLNNLKSDNWELTIIDDGAYKSVVVSMINEYGLNGKIKIRPFLDRESLLKEYQKYDYFISLSDMETLGMTYIEALSRGVNVICLSYSTTDELFESNKNVHLLHGKDPAILGPELASILDNGLCDFHEIDMDFFNQYTYKSAASKLVIKYK